MTDEPRSAIDELLPEFRFTEHHQLAVHASVEETWAALHRTDFARPLIPRLLMGLRSLPAALLDRKLPRRATLTLRDLAAGGFKVLRESEPSEIVLGIVGEFWRPAANIRAFEPAEFRSISPEEVAKAAWNFRLTPLDAARTLLETETRIACSGGVATKFRRYWFFARPFSGLIRIVMLREIAREAMRSRRR